MNAEKAENISNNGKVRNSAAHESGGQARRTDGKAASSGGEYVVDLLRRRDPEGLRIIMELYHDKLFSVAYGICKNHADAEEVLQDVYMTALNKIDRFEGRSNLSTWLHRITVNGALMKLRSQRSGKHTISMEDASPFLGQDDFLYNNKASRLPDDILISKELCEQVFESVEALPNIYQNTFFLRDVQGFSVKEASELLSATPAAIKSRLHRSRFFIRENLSQYLNEN